MTFTFRVSSFLCLLAAFIWQIGTETQWAVGSHVDEEEKKINIVFGNLSLKSTLPPPGESVTTKVPYVEDLATESELTTDSGQPLKASNISGYDDDLHQDFGKDDTSPENSVDRSNANNDFYKDDDPKLETSSVSYAEEEPSTEFDASSDDKIEPESFVPDDDAETLNSTDCSDADLRCKVSNFQAESSVSPLLDDEASPTASIITLPSTPTPLWNIVRSINQEDPAAQTSSVTFTPYKTTTGLDTLSTNTESSTTVQTSENLIPVEGSVVNKLDNANNAPVNKTEKSKPTKLSDMFSSSDDRTFSKIASTTPVLPVTKGDVSEDSADSTSLLSKMFEAISITTPGSYAISMDTYDLESSDIFMLPSSKAYFNEELVTSSSVTPRLYMPSELHSPLPPVFNTPSWNKDKSSPSFGDESSVKHISNITPRLLPSFRESSTTTEAVTEAASSSLSSSSPSSLATETDPSVSTYTVTSSLPDLLVSTLQPELNNRIVPKDSTPITTSDEENIPPPRWTNPGCPSLPICIEITLLDTTWAEFCSQAREFQEFLSKVVSHYVHSVHPHQIILEAENCVHISPVYPVQSSPDVTVALFVTDDSGEYTERLTEICALILKKWAPTTFRNSALEVRLFNSELQSTSIPMIPELNSGFVAAVSISAVAGVALCMLCILLVVMKQKLLQSRNSQMATPAGDAYSLDSLSINASFRRRRNRRSARSYLNHAFSDQEIPSHPLNEKTLQNCLKNRDLLEEEFKKIPMNMPKLSEIPEGAHVKNRYSNILPRPETRVLLADPSGDPLKCYINANYIKGYAGKASTYIACQAPLPEGIEDFWRMIWEQQCRVIIMLTMFEENGTSRCAVYFPQSTLVSQPPYGDFQVSLLKKDVYEFYTMSTLRLLDLEKNLFRDVVHLWYTKWPDVGVPKDPSCLITFVQQCRSFINCNAGPTVVHCSTGTGRTGVFLALDICMREYDESRSIDILQCISQLRRDRGGAVQNKDQYILIHEAMLEYISRMANQSQRSSIQS